MPSSDLDRAVNKERRGVRKRERTAVERIDRSYRVALRAYRTDLAAVQDLIEIKQANGDDVSNGLLFRERRLQALVDQAEQAAQITADAAKAAIREQGAITIQEAQDDLRRQILAGIGPGPDNAVLSFATMPSEALNELTASLGPGSPVVELLDKLAGEARILAEDELIAGLGRGDSPRTIGKRLMNILNVSRGRAELIAQETIFRAHRKARSESFKANRKLLNGWIWSAALDERTCVICYAMNGTEHSVDEELHSHPRCRCTQRPKTKSWPDLGFPGVDEPSQESHPTGVNLFDGLDGAAQKRILGLAALEAYSAGEVNLPDFVQKTNHPTWGQGKRRRSLDDAIAAGSKRRRGRAAKPGPMRAAVGSGDGSDLVSVRMKEAA